MAFSLRNRFVLLLSVLCLFASCSEDFIVGAPYKHVTVVYGLLNAGDTANYIRIQKAFYDENRGALDLAQVADSNFFDSVVVHLREINGANILSDDILSRVDLNTEGYPKAPGTFFTAPNYAYKTKRALNPDNRYRVVVVNKFTGITDSAETAVIPYTSSRFRVDEFVFGFVLNFSGVSEKNTFSLTITVPDNAQVFDGIIRFHYVEKDAGAGTQKDSSIDWTFASAQRIEGRASLTLSIPQRAFFSFLRNAIPDAGTNITRYIDTAEVFVWAGSQEFATYQTINGAQGGLTADQIKPIYTNIKGDNAYGLLASRSMRSRLAPVDDQSLDSLMNGATTRPLNFRGRSDH